MFSIRMPDMMRWRVNRSFSATFYLLTIWLLRVVMSPASIRKDRIRLLNFSSPWKLVLYCYEPLNTTGELFISLETRSYRLRSIAQCYWYTKVCFFFFLMWHSYTCIHIHAHVVYLLCSNCIINTRELSHVAYIILQVILMNDELPSSIWNASHLSILLINAIFFQNINTY